MNTLINKLRFIKAGIFVLLVWSMQVSFVVADQQSGLNSTHIPEIVSISVPNDQHHDQMQSTVGEINSCHPGSNMNCEFEQCASCLFYIAQEFVLYVTITAVSSITPVLIESPRDIQSTFYRPPQINS